MNIPLQDLQEHLELILTKANIVRYQSYVNENGVTNHMSEIIGINELIQLNHGISNILDIHNTFEGRESRILSIAMVLLNELFGHCKDHENYSNNIPVKYHQRGTIQIHLETKERGESSKIL